MIRYIVSLSIACIVGCYPGTSMGLEADASYTNTDGIVQISAAGKHWLNRAIRVDGRYNKVEGRKNRFSYGILSRNMYKGLVFESHGRMYDTHKMLSGSAGLAHKLMTISVGMQKEFPVAENEITLGSFTGRLAKWLIGQPDNKNLTVEGSYTYLYGEGPDRHDYRAESRLSGKNLYTGARYEHVRDVTIQSLFLGLVW